MKKVYSKFVLAALFFINITTTFAAENDVPHQGFKEYFIKGGPAYMAPILLCLIIGLAVAIERVIYLTMATTNTKKLLENVEDALKNGGVEAAIFYQGLDRANEGIDIVEKSVVSYGGVQMGQLEKNISWISLFISIAPMLGFMGTVIGMIQAFEKISLAGGLDASLIAGDIQVALLTTVFGLIVAMILQVFYNYIVAKVDSLVNDMEDASISLVDLLVTYKK